MHTPPASRRVGAWKLLSFKLTANESSEGQFPIWTSYQLLEKAVSHELSLILQSQ